VPLIGFIAAASDSAGLHENRNLSPSPGFGIDPIDALPAQIEAYYADRFGFRSEMVRSYNTLLHKYLRASNNDVVFGKDGWLFYAREKIFSDFLGKDFFTDSELSRWKDHLEKRQAILAKRNIRYLFVVAPDKNTVYPELLPDYLVRNRGMSRLEQLRTYLRNGNSSIELLDLHDALINEKPKGVLYFPQDTHWNGRGLFVAYDAILRAVRRWYPDVVPQTLGRDYSIQIQPWIGGDWNLFGLPEENLNYTSEFLVPARPQSKVRLAAPFPKSGIPPIPEPWNAPLYWEGKGAHSLLILHDSFMRTGALDRDETPFAEGFARTMLVGIRASNEQLDLIVDAFHPDIVIEERAERTLDTVPTSPNGAGQKPDTGIVPTLISFSPSAGLGVSQIFTTVYGSSAGGGDILSTQVMINGVMSSSNACYFGYDVGRNEFLLLDDTGKGWLPKGVRPGSGSIGNQQCSINGAGSSVVTAWDRMTVTYDIRFNPQFSGNKTIWTNAYSVQSGLGSAWQSSLGNMKFAWTVSER
jgi:hypothetical protein